MTPFEKRMYLIALILSVFAVAFLTTGVHYLMSISEEKETKDCNCNPKFYDYIIDLKQDEIFVYREDGREFIVHPDSLNEFILEDNL